MATTELIALVQNSNQIQGCRPKLIEFYGYEGEDFRHFQELLDSYLILSNTHSDNRELAILKSQLHRAAKIYFEKTILKDHPQVTYDEAMKHLKSHYITPELIQNYELEFNDMIQGDQEHPQISLSRLREAVIESRFRAGLLRDIKQFCIQSSARTFQDWLNHAERWWNANHPRKVAMVDSLFIPRNVNNALIYHDDGVYHQRYPSNDHNIELIDANERPAQVIPISNLHPYGMVNTVIPNPQIVSGPNQLSTLEITRNNYHAQNYPRQVQRNNGAYPSQHNHQKDLVNLIQQTIRNEVGNQQQYQSPVRYYNRRNRYNDNYQNQYQNNNNGYNNNDYNNNIYNNNGYQHNDNNYGRQDYSNQGRNRNSFNNQTCRPQYNRPLPQQPQTQQPNQPKN